MAVARPAPVASAGPFAPGGLLSPGGPFRPPDPFGPVASYRSPAPLGWVGEPVQEAARPARRGGRHRLRTALAVVVTVALLVAATGVYLKTRPGSVYPSQWDTRVASIVPFVEQQRGLKFLHPVPVDFLADDQFTAKVGSGPALTAKQQVDLGHFVGELRAVGLIHGDADLAAMTRQLKAQSVIGLYVPKDKRIYVRGSTVTPGVRVTLAHELTHALQDQHVDLSRLLRLPHVDSTAVLALVEGDAVRVQNAYVAAMSADDKATYQESSAAQVVAANLKGFPEFLIDGQSFPYIFGPVFVDALVASGGTAAIDHAFANPPTVDAQVVDPNRYLIQTDVPTVVAPALETGDTRLSPPQAFGQVSMLQVVAATVGYQAAWTALQSWRGDQAVDYLRGGQACLAIATVFDAPEHAAAFQALAQRWAAGRSGVSISATDKTVVLRACDPGAAAATGVAASPTPFEVLTLRSSILAELIAKVKAPADVAGCIADQIILAVGPAALMPPATSGAGNPAVPRALAQAGKTCGLAGA